MPKDLRPILRDWPYDPDDIVVRVIDGDDGREKIQLRLELGLLQMEMHGRPDGDRPEQCESWLDYYEQQYSGHETANPDAAPLELDEEARTRLLREGIQYYHRYVSLWHLQKYDLCARDTARNLRLFSFVRDHTHDEHDKLQFDQWRPYVTMMHTRAVVTPLVVRKQFAEAAAEIDKGIRGIWDFLEEYSQTERAEQCNELSFLENWRKEIAEQRAGAEPPSKLGRLQARLDEAVAEERYEDAASLRDEIRRESEAAR